MDEHFEILGLTENEQRVYMTVLEQGKVSHVDVARLTNINRTTVYSVAKKLQAIGLITEDLGHATTYLVAEPPEQLVALVQKEEAVLKKKMSAAKQLTEALAMTEAQQRHSVPRLRFFEDEHLIAQMYKAYDIVCESVMRYDSIWWGFHDDSFTQQYTDWIHWSWDHCPPGMQVHNFSNNTEPDYEMQRIHPERILKPLPSADFMFDASLWIAGDYIFMVQTRSKPHYMVEINDRVLARNQRELFKGLWNLSVPGEQKG